MTNDMKSAKVIEDKVPVDEAAKEILSTLLTEIEWAQLNYLVDRKVWYARWRELVDVRPRLEIE